MIVKNGILENLLEPPKGGGGGEAGMSDNSLLSGISGLSFGSPFLSLALFFYLVLLLALSGLFLCVCGGFGLLFFLRVLSRKLSSICCALCFCLVTLYAFLFCGCQVEHWTESLGTVLIWVPFPVQQGMFYPESAFNADCAHIKIPNCWQPYRCLDSKTLHTLVELCGTAPGAAAAISR